MQAAGPDPWPGGRECVSGDTMNTFTANDPPPGVAGLLAWPGSTTERRPAVTPPQASGGQAVMRYA
jgi:hypothetical protein